MILQEQHADLEQWQLQCRALGATPEQIAAYEESARRYARTTPYPNSEVVARARQLALDALKRGDPMPQDAEQVLQRAWANELARLFGPCVPSTTAIAEDTQASEAI